jgi:DNA-binding transcriptional ArsR family regulator
MQMKPQYNPADCQKLIEEKIDIPFFRAVFDPVRSNLIVFLASNGEMTIGAIAENFPQNRSVISRHLDMLHRFGAVERRKDGREVYYQVNVEFVTDKFSVTADNMKALMSLNRK